MLSSFGHFAKSSLVKVEKSSVLYVLDLFLRTSRLPSPTEEASWTGEVRPGALGEVSPCCGLLWVGSFRLKRASRKAKTTPRGLA